MIQGASDFAMAATSAFAVIDFYFGHLIISCLSKKTTSGTPQRSQRTQRKLWI
jgi:hypothetical protein